MAHWGWYWKVKKQHKARLSCSDVRLAEIDSFKMYKRSQQVDLVRKSRQRISFEVPSYNLTGYLQDDDSILVRHENGFYVLPVEKKRCNFGGYYYFFHCPLCSKRVRKLYCLSAQYQCRRCGNIAYYSQRLRPADRFQYMELNIKRLINDRGGDLYAEKKPSRMHRKSFARLRSKAYLYEAKNGLATYKDLRVWFGKKAEILLDKYFEINWQRVVRDYCTKEAKS